VDCGGYRRQWGKNGEVGPGDVDVSWAISYFLNLLPCPLQMHVRKGFFVYKFSLCNYLTTAPFPLREGKYVLC
jgi:hypothetical protein